MTAEVEDEWKTWAKNVPQTIGDMNLPPAAPVAMPAKCDLQAGLGTDGNTGQRQQVNLMVYNNANASGDGTGTVYTSAERDADALARAPLRKEDMQGIVALKPGPEGDGWTKSGGVSTPFYLAAVQSFEVNERSEVTAWTGHYLMPFFNGEPTADVTKRWELACKTGHHPYDKQHCEHGRCGRGAWVESFEDTNAIFRTGLGLTQSQRRLNAKSIKSINTYNESWFQVPEGGRRGKARA